MAQLSAAHEFGAFTTRNLQVPVDNFNSSLRWWGRLLQMLVVIGDHNPDLEFSDDDEDGTPVAGSTERISRKSGGMLTWSCEDDL